MLTNKLGKGGKCPYLELFWSVFPRIWTVYKEIRSISLVFSPNAGKYGPE